MVKRKKELNEPEIPSLSIFEEMEIDNVELAKAISRIKFFVPSVTEFLTEFQLEIVRKYAP